MRFFTCWCRRSRPTSNQPKEPKPIDKARQHAVDLDLDIASICVVPIQWSDTIPFVPPITQGIVIKVYDGDTITIAATLPYAESPLYRFSVRFAGIDCPEMKTKNDSEKQCAQLAQRFLSQRILNQVVHLRDCQTEKYGRILANVYWGDIHLNQLMLDQRLAVPYDGKTKTVVDNWLDYYYYGTQSIDV